MTSSRECIRAMMRKRLYEAQQLSGINATNIDNIAYDLERGCCNFAVRECERLGLMARLTPEASDHCTVTYTSLSARIADLLRDNGCELYQAIVSGRISAIDIARTNLETICPSIMRAERELFALRSGQHIEVQVSSLYRCKKCGMRRTTHEEHQTRSSDESPILSIKCLNCGHAWHQDT